MNILLLGSGGREHALAWKMAASPLVDRLICAPGNAGIAREAVCVALDIGDHAAVIAYCRQNSIDLVVVGPEAPLCAGIIDDLEAAAGTKAFGPSRAPPPAWKAPRASPRTCAGRTAFPPRPTNASARRRRPRPMSATAARRSWSKPDGLAAGKGVVVAVNVAEADAAIDMMFSGALGEAGGEIVVEEFLDGEEASFFALCDGTRALAFASAQDHKRAGDGDTGPNTGGMGAYSPAPIVDAATSARVMETIVLPTLRAMKAMGAPYKGVLFAGLMLTAAGPQLIEYNVRFGDPECQVLMLRLMSDLIPALLASRDGVLKSLDLRWFPQAALTVVMAAKGYPGTYARGSVIEGLDEAAAIEGVEIFHAGTKAESGRIVANGGRVLNIAALGQTVREAQSRAYEAISRIRWPEGFCRHDIGWRAVEREKQPSEQSLGSAARLSK